MKDAFLAEVQRAKAGFARLTLAGAHKVEVEGDRIVFSFAPAQKMFKDQVESNRTWLEPLAARVAGRKMNVIAVVSEPPAAAAAPARPGAPPTEKLGSPAGPSEALKAEAAADPGMQTLLELLPLEIKGVERM